MSETLAAEVEPWLQQCGSCDAGLPMGCTCPEGDYRNILLKVWRAYQASRLLVAEEIAEIAEEAADDLDLPVMADWLDQRDWFKTQLHALAAKARKAGGQ